VNQPERGTREHPAPAAADVELRGFHESDYEAIARIHTAVYPESPSTAEEVRHWTNEMAPEGVTSEWFIAEDRRTGAVAGYAWYHHTAWSFHPDKYRLRGNVHPAWEHQGIGRLLMETVLESLRARGARRVMAMSREDRPRGIAFLQRYGFAAYAREFESRLPVAGCDLSQFAGYSDRVAARGIELTTLAEELARDPHCLPAVYQLHSALSISTPREDPDPRTPPPYARFLALEVDHPTVLKDACFLAKHGDFYVGESALKTSEADPQVLYQQLTGVVPEYRGSGVATALKLRTVEYAHRHGYREIRTWNSSRNSAMLAINLKLGFVRQPAWIEFLKIL